MDLTFDAIYENLDKIVTGATIDLSAVTSLDPWAIGLLCLLAVERRYEPQKHLLLPDKTETADYLNKVGFLAFLEKISYGKFPREPASDCNVQEITHSLFRDDFNARLPQIKLMFRIFGIGGMDDVNRATVLVGELGNNVFDHNEGSWPTDVRGAIILGQNYPQERVVEIVVADPGIGFRQSLSTVDPNLTDVKAIKLGLQGFTGRIGEKRGNGLKLIQDWTVNKFDGEVRIHSGGGLVVVDGKDVRGRTVNPILGTLASCVIKYK
jgi:hypothetical protein